MVSQPEYRMLVPIPEDVVIANRDLNIEYLLQTAAAIASGQNGSILFVCCLTSENLPPESGTVADSARKNLDKSVEDRISASVEMLDQTIRRAHAYDENVISGGVVSLCTQPGDVLRYLVETRPCHGVLLLTGTPDIPYVFTQTEINSIRSHLSCDVIVERPSRMATESRVLIPHADDPFVERADINRTVPERIAVIGTERENAALAAEVARSLAEPRGIFVDSITVVAHATDQARDSSVSELMLFVLGATCGQLVVTSNSALSVLTSDELFDKYDTIVFGLPDSHNDLTHSLFESGESTFSPTTGLIGVQSGKSRERALAYRYLQLFENSD